jgi:hypothetical protein
MYEKTIVKRKVLLLGIVCFLFLLFAPVIHAENLAPAKAKFTVFFEGVDPITGELLFEGERTEPIPGDLSIRMVVTRQSGVALHFWACWTVTNTWGETISGENTGLLNTASLHFREHGVIIDATGSLSELIGNFIVIHGQVSDLSFIPGTMEVNGTATIVPSQAN